MAQFQNKFQSCGGKIFYVMKFEVSSQPSSRSNFEFSLLFELRNPSWIIFDYSNVVRYYFPVFSHVYYPRINHTMNNRWIIYGQVISAVKSTPHLREPSKYLILMYVSLVLVAGLLFSLMHSCTIFDHANQFFARSTYIHDISNLLPHLSAIPEPHETEIQSWFRRNQHAQIQFFQICPFQKLIFIY